MEITTKKYYTRCLCGRTSTNEEKKISAPCAADR